MKADPTAKLHALIWGFGAALAGLNVLLAVLNGWLASPIGWDTPGRPLPTMVILIIMERTAWLIVALTLLVLAALVALFACDRREGQITLSVLGAAAFIQVCLTSMALSDYVFPGPFEGFWMTPREQASTFYDFLMGDGSKWFVCSQWMIGSLTLVISLYLFWRFLMNSREIPTGALSG